MLIQLGEPDKQVRVSLRRTVYSEGTFILSGDALLSNDGGQVG